MADVTNTNPFTFAGAATQPATQPVQTAPAQVQQFQPTQPQVAPPANQPVAVKPVVTQPTKQQLAPGKLKADYEVKLAFWTDGSDYDVLKFTVEGDTPAEIAAKVNAINWGLANGLDAFPKPHGDHFAKPRSGGSGWKGSYNKGSQQPQQPKSLLPESDWEKKFVVEFGLCSPDNQNLVPNWRTYKQKYFELKGTGPFLKSGTINWPDHGLATPPYPPIQLQRY